MKSRLMLGLAAFAALAMTAAPSSAQHQRFTPEAQYTGGGAVVVKQNGRPPLADEGALVCRPNAFSGIGGGCVSFGAWPGASAVSVQDVVNGRSVPFQVCIDNNGDGACVSPDEGACADQIFFSHDDRGTNHNPLGPLPTGFASGCPGGAWHGYVVFICNGVHDAGGAHSHPATTGSILTLNTAGTGFGTFCGGPPQDPSNKRYVVLPA